MHPLFDGDALEAIRNSFDALVLHGRWHGKPPGGVSNYGGKMIKVANVRLSDATIGGVILNKRIAALAADLLGASAVYLWADSLYWKGPGAVGEQAVVGWHQDKRYWPESGTNRMVTACVALNQAGPGMGSLCFVDGSHRWGLVDDAEALVGAENAGGHARPETPPGRVWEERCPVVSPGGVTFHHCLTLHSSGENRSATPRRSITIHMIADDATFGGPRLFP